MSHPNQQYPASPLPPTDQQYPQQPSEDRKRRIEDSSSDYYPPAPTSSSSSIPPPAKRIKEEKDDVKVEEKEDEKMQEGGGFGLGPEEEEFIITFQKQAIWRQMQEYKRLYQRSLNNNNKLVKTQSNYETNVTEFERFCIQLEEDLQFLLDRFTTLEPSTDTPLQHPPPTSTLLTLIKSTTRNSEVKDALRKKWDSMTHVIGELVSRLDMVGAKRDEEVMKSGDEEIGRLVEGRKVVERKMEELQVKSRNLSEKLTTLKSEHELTKKRMSELEDELDDTRTKLLSAEKTLEKAKMGLSIVEKPVAAAAAAGSSATDEEAGVKAENGVKVEGVDIRLLQDELSLKTQLSETRLQELESLRHDKTALQTTIDSLKIQISGIPESRVLESDTYRDLYTKYSMLKSEVENLRVVNEKRGNEIAELELSRQTLLEKVAEETKSQHDAFRGELKKLELDLTRLRGHRDSLQQHLDARVAKDDASLKQMEEINVLSEARKGRIAVLESELARLKLLMATNMGDRALVEFFETNPQGNPLEDLRGKITQLESRNQELEAFVQGHSSTSGNEQQLLSQALAREKSLQSQLDTLTKRLQELESLVGSDHLKQLQQLQLKCETLETTSTTVMTEMETISSAWQSLEEQNSRKVLNLVQKEDQIMRLIAEKTKLDQKCQLLSKQAATANNSTIALKRQSDKTVEVIKKHEEREKTLQRQVDELTREIRQQQLVLEAHQRQAVEFTGKHREVVQKLDYNKSQYAEMEKLLAERTALLENETHAKRRLQEELVAAKKRITNLSRLELSADSQKLLKEVENYKLLLKCSSCNNRFKSVVLKCMHTFCKECIDDLISTRQRKCPTCGIAFGVNDVKTVYL